MIDHEHLTSDVHDPRHTAERPADLPPGFARCGACGSTIAPRAWERLPYVGLMPSEVVGAPLEMRNCVCGSTIARAYVPPSSGECVELLRELRDAELAADRTGDWADVERIHRALAQRTQLRLDHASAFGGKAGL